MDPEQRIADRVYYRRRAAEERQKAHLCEDIRIALIHLHMAEEYARKAGPIPIQGADEEPLQPVSYKHTSEPLPTSPGRSVVERR